MAHFTYRAKKANGEVYKGTMDSADRYELYKILKESGDEALDVREVPESKFFSMKLSFSFNRSVKTQDKINFAKNLGSMITAGLALSRALSVMERQAKSKALKDVLVGLQKNVSSGKTLSQSMALYNKVFSPLFISMVSAGEQSGNLASSLKIVGNQLEKAYALQRKIRGAMTYPAIILFVMVLIAILMLTFIVPTLTKTFTDLKIELPLTTRSVIFVSNLVLNHGLLVLLGLIAVVGGILMWRKSPSGKQTLHYLLLRIPIIGNLIKEVNSARTARTLSSLLSSGVDVVQSVRITRDVIQNVYYKAVLEKAGIAIEKGDSMSQVFVQNNELYPVFVGEMLNVGEETGKIGEMLMNVAVYYEDDVEQKTKDMSTIIEPFLMVIIGIAVGFFALAMISPMYSLVDVL